MRASRSTLTLMRILAVLFLSVLALGGCAPAADDASTATPEARYVDERPPLSEVLARHAPRLIAMPGVNMIYESLTPDGDPCVKIGVEHLTSELRESLPRTLDGWPVLVIEAGEIRPLDPR